MRHFKHFKVIAILYLLATILVPFEINIIASSKVTLYTRISDITPPSSPQYSTERDLTIFHLNFSIEIFNPTNETQEITTINWALLMPCETISFENDTIQGNIDHYLLPMGNTHSILPYTTMSGYPVSLYIDPGEFDQLPNGNYTFWFRFDAYGTDYEFQYFHSYINVTDGNFVITHEDFDDSLFTIPKPTSDPEPTSEVHLAFLDIIRLIFLVAYLMHKRKI